MKIFSVAWMLAVIVSCGQTPESVIHEASALEAGGDFSGAETVLKEAIKRTGDHEYRKTLEFEADRLRRIRMDYPYTRERMWEIVESAVKDVTREEFERWVRGGKFDVRTIDGEERFVNTSRSNLFWRYPDIAARRVNPPERTAFERRVWENARAIRLAAESAGTSYVLPKTFRVHMTVKAGPNAAPPGKIIRAWLPVPRVFPFQTDFRLIDQSSEVRLDEEQSPIRSAFMEQTAIEDEPTEFRIEYSYTHAGIWFRLDPELAETYEKNDPDVNRFLREDPHVAFSEKMKKVSLEVVADETNPVKIARAVYEWIAANIKYSYALEYSTIRDLGAYCIENGYGDCGQEALLFITLCRMNGIPARWQSGWFTFPGGKTIHDWTEIYLKPWGWVPVDPYMGIFAMQYLNSLTDEQKQDVRDFYFGGLDQFRMAANSDHAQTLRPGKRSMRSDNVDFQRGELEYDETNIYFDKYSYRLTAEEILNH